MSPPLPPLQLKDATAEAGGQTPYKPKYAQERPHEESLLHGRFQAHFRREDNVALRVRTARDLGVSMKANPELRQEKFYPKLHPKEFVSAVGHSNSKWANQMLRQETFRDQASSQG